nr:fatty acid desaturase 2-like protein FADS2P1 [Equus caballus]
MKGEKKVILMIQSEVRSRSFESQPRNPKGSMMMKFEEKHEGSGSLVGKRQPYLGEKHQGNLKPEANEKAKASMKQEANGDCCEKLRKILNRYSWQEIQKHNQKAEQWIVICRKVYDVTGWANRHPGGHRVLNYCAGEDATLVEYFQELWRKLEAMNMFNVNLGFFSLYLAQMLILEATAWLILWHFGNGWPITILISFLLTISEAQSCFLQHDMGHLSIFKKSKWNRLMQKFVMCHLKGISRNWWNHGHFQCHVKPNICSKDQDINLGSIILFGDIQPVEYGKKKIKYINCEKQHLLFYTVALPFFMPIYVNVQSIQQWYFRRYWGEFAWISSFYIHYFIIFGHFYGTFGTLGLIYLVKSLESRWIVYVTQMSHVPMKMSREENRDWLSTQVLATCNVEQSFFNDWFTRHLNFQIEHHLFPTMLCHNYHKVAPLVRSLCAKHGLQYVNKPLLKAFGDIVRAMKKSGALWKDAYYKTGKHDAESQT